MKFNILNCRMVACSLAVTTGLILYSCNNSEESGNNSTKKDSMGYKDSLSRIDTTKVTPSIDTSKTSRARNRTGRAIVSAIPENRSGKITADATGYYNYTEVAPMFSGGQSAISDYITNNIVYPQDAIDNAIEGTVNVQFGIDENGNISRVKAIGDPMGYGLEDAAVKVVSGMPKWKSGSIKGKKVKSWMILPITFRLEG
jgi:periplasmic protein TonB